MDDYLEEIIAGNDETYDFIDSMDNKEVLPESWLDEDYDRYDIEKALTDLFNCIDDAGQHHA